MRVLAIADQHGYLPPIKALPPADLLLIAGDLCPVDLPHDPQTQVGWLRKRYAPWLKSIDIAEKVVIAGNHDFAFMRTVYNRFGTEKVNQKRDKAQAAITNTGAIYLEDTNYSVEVDGETWKIHGTPWTPKFLDWAYMLPDALLSEKWALIPLDTDIVVVHGPPAGIGDTSLLAGEPEHDHGSISLRRRLCEMNNLSLTVFGHIHGGRGIYIDNNEPGVFWPKNIKGVLHNVSLRDDHYRVHPVEDLKTVIHLVEVTKCLSR